MILFYLPAIASAICPATASLALQGQFGDALGGDDGDDIGINTETWPGDFQVVGDDHVHVLLFSAWRWSFNQIARLHREAADDSFSGLCTPTQARISSVRSSAIFNLAVVFFHLIDGHGGRGGSPPQRPP